MHDFEWFAERLEPVKVSSDVPGQRDWMTRCPVHGGSDTLHLEEKNGKALLHCFHPACAAHVRGHGYVEVVTALEGEGAQEDLEHTTDTPDAPDAPDEEACVPTIRRRKRSSELEHQEHTTDAPDATDPLEWCASRCGMTRDELESLNLPLSARGKRLVFEFGRPDVFKTRAVGESKKKDITWVGSLNPPIWPVPSAPPDDTPDFVLTEGEFDAIVVRAAGYHGFSITGGASNVPDAAAFRAMKQMGWQRAIVLFDQDDAGRKGLESVLDALREADIETAVARVVGIQPLMDEKDARDVALRTGASAITLEWAEDSDAPVALSEVEAIVPEPLALGMLHPREHTILYGDGGTGKGVIAAWLVAHLVMSGERVLVVDYEAHAQHEWRPRVDAFLTHHHMQHLMRDHVHIVQPGAKPIWEIQDWLRDQARRVKATWMVIDSVTYACIKDAEVSETAIRYSHAIARMKMPVLSIAHVTKADANPRHPFGSIYWSNGARVTIAVSRKTQGDPESPRLLKNWKSNQRREFPDKEIAWDWVSKQDGPPDDLVFEEVKKSDAEIVRAFIDEYTAAHGQPPSNAEIQAATGMSSATIRTTKSRTPKITRVKRSEEPTE